MIMPQLLKMKMKRENFLLNEETDIEGRIIECLKGIIDVDDEFFEGAYFDIYSDSYIDEYSLYKPVTRKTRVKPDAILDEYEDDPEEIKRLSDKLFKDNEYSVYRINEFVLSQIGDKRQIHASDIKINEFNDILLVFLIQLYSENTSVGYCVKYIEETYKELGYVMHDYIIERKVS